jgi:DNA helicase II / ATP-dependent DNA helicase PcrA
MPLEFTGEQKAVINHTLPGDGRVFAGPGTGKSATAVGLAEQLSSNEENQPRLKFLTFTRAATLELAKKLPIHGKIKPATIHSFSIATLLRNPGCAPFPQPLRIADRYEYEELVRPHLARRSGVNVSRLDDLVREMAAKWESLNPLELPEVTADERARFMGAYIEHRHTFGYTLLNELPDLLRGALRDHTDLDGVKFDLLIVDEYQDLNACELELLKRLGERGASILAIGDDDQSIYSFRKAHPIGIRRFTDDYPGAKDYALSICQRLPQRIAEWAQFVIAGQVGRRRQPIQCKPGAAMGTVGLLNFRSEVTEARGIADLIGWLNHSEGIPLSEILILSRTDYRGTFTRRIRDELNRRNIVVFDQSQVGKILGEPQNRKLLALLRVAVNRRDSLAWWTLIHLERGIGPKFIDGIYEAAVGTGTTFGEALVDAGEAGFPEFADAIKRRVVKFYKATVEIVEQLEIPTASPDIKWGEWINSLNGSVSESTEEFKTLLRKIDETYPDAADGLDRYLSQIQPFSEDLARAQSDGVRFMTMVGSKGLTVRATIVVGVDNDLVPRPDQDLSEERRLLYVAMTRSTDALFLTWANRRRGPGARAGNPNPGRRTYSEFLRSGPVESEDGVAFIRRAVNRSGNEN